MRFIVRSVPQRAEYVEILLASIPDLVIIEDVECSARLTRCAIPNMLRALIAAGDGPAVHLEDDIVLTGGFEKKIKAAIAERPDSVIQFFSMRKADLLVGSRLEPGRSFMMTQCFYLPSGMSADLLDYAANRPPVAADRTGQDSLVQDWLAARRLRYWLHVPNLVDHRQIVSAIDKRRSRNRVSLTFQQ